MKEVMWVKGTKAFKKKKNPQKISCPNVGSDCRNKALRKYPGKKQTNRQTNTHLLFLSLRKYNFHQTVKPFWIKNPFQLAKLFIGMVHRKYKGNKNMIQNLKNEILKNDFSGKLSRNIK